MQVVKKLKGSKDHNMVQWGSLIKDFSEKYENHVNFFYFWLPANLSHIDY